MHVRRRLRRTAAVALGLMAAAPAAAWAADPPTRYSLANGCYALQSSSGQVVAGGDHVRMQATTLGSYLLWNARERRRSISVTDGSRSSPRALR